MQTTTTTHRSLGHELAAKLHRSKLRRGRRRPRTKRPAKRPPPKPRANPRVAQFERQLGRTENGRRALRLMGRIAQAKVAEEAASIGLEAVESTEARIRKRLLAVGVPQTAEAYCEAERLQGDLLAAEHKTRRWRAEHARHRGERERLEGELAHLAQYI